MRGAKQVCADVQAPAQSREVFLKRVADLVNSGDEKGFQALLTSETSNETGWIGGHSALSPKDAANTRPWRALPLPLPTAEGETSVTLVALTRYHPAESQGDHVYALVQDEQGQWKLGKEYVEDAQGAPDGPRILSHTAQITLDPQSGVLTARDRIHLVRHADASGSYVPAPHIFLMRLNDGYKVDTFRVGGKAIPFRQVGGIIAFRADEIPAGSDKPSSSEENELLVYHGKVAQGDEDYILPQEAALSGYYLPHIGRLPVTYDIQLTVPRGWAAFTQGVLQGKTLSADKKTVTFAYRNNLPVCYPSLAAGPYQVYEAASAQDKFTVAVAYLHGSDRDVAVRAWHTAQAALHFYHTHFSPYPYPRYTVVVSDRYAMALEGYSMTTIARGYVPNVLPHEISHTWWGGIVPNTYLRDLWNESFAEYSDGLYMRLGKRQDGMHLQEMQTIMTLGFLDRQQAVSVRQANDPLDVGQALVGYLKGSAILETLEGMLGQPAMLTAMQTFIAQHKPGEAETWDGFIRAVTTTAGPQWKAFFDGWLTTKGVPTLSLAGVHVENGPKGKSVVGELKQTGEAVYWLKVPLRLRLKSGAALNQAVTMNADHIPFHIVLPANTTPEMLEIDPQNTTLHNVGAGASQTKF